MQKQRIVEVEHVEDTTIAYPEPRARPDLRLASADDVSVVGPARQLQHDLAKAFTAQALPEKSGWTVKRTVIAGIVFHAVVLGSLALAASNLALHLTH